MGVVSSPASMPDQITTTTEKLRNTSITLIPSIIATAVTMIPAVGADTSTTIAISAIIGMITATFITAMLAFIMRFAFCKNKNRKEVQDTQLEVIENIREEELSDKTDTT